MLYAINKTGTNLQLKGGSVQIQRGSFKAVSKEELEHPHFVHAKDNGWIEITEDEPTAEFLKSIDVINSVTRYQGMTIEEVRASEKATKPKEGRVTPIGRPAEPEELDDQDTEEQKIDDVLGSDTSPKRGRKTAASPDKTAE